MKKKLLLLATCLFPVLMANAESSDIIINEENFPDKNFRAVLMSQSYGKDGIITKEEIKNHLSNTVL